MRYWLFVLVAVSSLAESYTESIEAWRRERADKLRAPTGWLTVSGLFWLNDGTNAVGSDPACEIELPTGRAPLRLGVFEFRNGRTEFRPVPGAKVTVNGHPAAATVLKADDSGAPDLIQTGDFTMFVIRRGTRHGVRLRDLHSEMREHFVGLKWYPVQPAYRVVARWHAYPEPRGIPIPNVLGQTEMQPSPGYAEFELGGKTLRLDPVLEGKLLFFIFRDLTSRKSTYGAGRFLDANPPENGKVVLDFNQAYNPPCAFTAHATCPLPPQQNRLPVAIEAGELRYPGGTH